MDRQRTGDDVAGSPMIEAIWLTPPIAFARFGAAPTPMENFHWADNNYAPRGTAETFIEPTWTLEVDEDGVVSSYMPTELRFREKNGDWRPVCPFFEIWARWSDKPEGPLTIMQLQEIGCDLEQVRWTVETANRKAYHYALNEDDLVQARVELAGSEHERTELQGKCPDSADNPIVPPGTVLPFGHAQVIRPTDEFPVLRLRITPPAGRIYAPTNTVERNLTALLPANLGKDAFLDGIHLILNPKSDWASWVPTGGDSRTNPGDLYAQEPSDNPNVGGKSLGFLDDSSDGRISVALECDALPQGRLVASAAFTCCPPDFQPDRRPFVSVADGLADEQLREEVLEPAYVEGDNWAETEAEIADLMERVRETMEASNLDHQNLRSALANPPSDAGPLVYPFEPQEPTPGHPFPLLERGRDNHKRFLAYAVFKRRLIEYPSLFDKLIRHPTAEPGPYDSQMPALMRGSDANPMTLTQREYLLLSAWLEELRKIGDR